MSTSDSQPPNFTPRLNHVAISVDPALMDEKGRKELLDFYGEVFGWTEGDNTGEKGNPLILYTGTFSQFVYLLPRRLELGDDVARHGVDVVGAESPEERLHARRRDG